jgi:branched-chain amino acid transport system substrate-binding protein
LLIVGVIIIVVLFLFLNQKNDSQSVRVGVILPLSGQYAMFGEGLKNAIELEKSNSDLDSQKRVQIFYEDDKYEAKTAVSAYKKLKDFDKVDVVVVLSAPSIEALRPLVAQDGTIMFTLGESLFHEKDTVFQLMPAGDLIFPKLGEKASTLYKNIAVVHSNSSLFQLNSDLFKKGLSSSTTQSDFTISSQDDIRTAVTKVLVKNPDAVTVMLPVENGIQFLKELKKQMGSKKISVVCDANIQYAIDQYVKAVGENMFDGCISSTLPNTFADWFLKQYKDKYNSDPIITADYAYDSIGIIKSLTEKYPLSKWTDVLSNSNYQYSGASGIIKFNPDGTRVGGADLYKFESGKFVKTQ